MIKVAVLDDYQNAFEQIVNVDKYKDKFEFKVFQRLLLTRKELYLNEDFEALFIMRENPNYKIFN